MSGRKRRKGGWKKKNVLRLEGKARGRSGGKGRIFVYRKERIIFVWRQEQKEEQYLFKRREHEEEEEKKKEICLGEKLEGRGGGEER